jgi:hypothetical protein
VLNSTSVTFTWNTGAGVTSTYLWLGTTPGGSNLLVTPSGTATTATATGLPLSGAPIYARLFSVINGVTGYNDYTYTMPLMAMISPTPGTVLPLGPVTFTWTTASAVSSNALYIGTTLGGQNLDAVNTGTVTSYTVTLPANGATLYVRLWAFAGGVWQYIDYTYTEIAGVKAVISSPTPGSVLPGTSVTFNWTAGSGATSYALYIGTTLGGQQLAAVNTGTVTSYTAALPGNGVPVYVTLWSLIGGVWQSNSYTYTAITAVKAAMGTPVPSSVLTSTSVTFKWTAGFGVSSYALYIGTTPGGQQLVAVNTGTATSYAAANLPVNGTPIYVTLWSLISGVWQSNSYTYTAMTAAKATMASPTPGSVLTGAGPSITFTWNGNAGIASYAMYIGTTLGGQELIAVNTGTATSYTAALPVTGSTIYVTLWSKLAGVWQSNAYTYTR